jgi:HAD superfamily hydrolase (TIGR01458 family)
MHGVCFRAYGVHQRLKIEQGGELMTWPFGKGNPPRAILIDLDGTLYTGNEPLPGARRAVKRLRQEGIPLRVLTNTTRTSRRDLGRKLERMGFQFHLDEIFNAPTAAARWLAARGLNRVMPLVGRGAWEDLEGLTVVPPEEGAGAVDAVLVGDLGEDLSFGLLNRAFLALDGGAELAACQKNRYWQSPEGLLMDAGPIVAALEYASGKEATVVGKPSAEFFHHTFDPPDGDHSRILMVGDDLAADVGGAQAAGLKGVLVKTGKFRQRDIAPGAPVPDMVLDSFAGLPAALGLN